MAGETGNSRAARELARAAKRSTAAWLAAEERRLADAADSLVEDDARRKAAAKAAKARYAARNKRLVRGQAGKSFPVLQILLRNMRAGEVYTFKHAIDEWYPRHKVKRTERVRELGGSPYSGKKPLRVFWAVKKLQLAGLVGYDAGSLTRAEKLALSGDYWIHRRFWLLPEGERFAEVCRVMPTWLFPSGSSVHRWRCVLGLSHDELFERFVRLSRRQSTKGWWAKWKPPAR